MKHTARSFASLMTLLLGLGPACDVAPVDPDDLDATLEELEAMEEQEEELEALYAEVLEPIDEPESDHDDGIEPSFTDVSQGRTLVEGPDGLMVVTYEDIGGHAVVDGDIDLGLVEELPQFPSIDLDDPDLELDQVPRAFTPVPIWGMPWTGGIVRYVAPNTGSPAIDANINAAIATMEAETDLDFVAVPSHLSFLYDHIYFTPSWSVGQWAGRSDSIGRKGGRQYIYMSMVNMLANQSPSQSLFLHELGHAVGLYHEHQRHDRDNHVLYLPWCVQSGKSGNFDKRTGIALGPYDTSSIMHYGTNTFSNGCPTLISVTGAPLGGNSLSPHDIAALDWLAGF